MAYVVHYNMSNSKQLPVGLMVLSDGMVHFLKIKKSFNKSTKTKKLSCDFKLTEEERGGGGGTQTHLLPEAELSEITKILQKCDFYLGLKISKKKIYI